MFTANECVLRSHANNWIFISLRAVNYLCQCWLRSPRLFSTLSGYFHCNIVRNEEVLPGGWLGWVHWHCHTDCPPAVIVWSALPLNSITQSISPSLGGDFPLKVRRCHPQVSHRWSAGITCSLTDSPQYYPYNTYSDQLCYTALHRCILSSYM